MPVDFGSRCFVRNCGGRKSSRVGCVTGNFAHLIGHTADKGTVNKEKRQDTREPRRRYRETRQETWNHRCEDVHTYTQTHTRSHPSIQTVEETGKETEKQHHLWKQTQVSPKRRSSGHAWSTSDCMQVRAETHCCWFFGDHSNSGERCFLQVCCTKKKNNVQHTNAKHLSKTEMISIWSQRVCVCVFFSPTSLSAKMFIRCAQVWVGLRKKRKKGLFLLHTRTLISWNQSWGAWWGLLLHSFHVDSMTDRHLTVEERETHANNSSARLSTQFCWEAHNTKTICEDKKKKYLKVKL